MNSRIPRKSRGEAVVLAVWRWVGTRWFWYVSLALLTVQALYIALVGRFSMAFDEYYHLGTIQQYAKVWLPWSVEQPAGPAAIGAVPADGSYLYHYLMSFPYRIMTHFVASETVQLIVLRCVDVGIVLLGFYIFRRLLLRVGMSRPAVHSLLFLIMLLPITPWLSGQLTYDVLWFTMTAVTTLVAIRLLDEVRDGSTVPFLSFAWLLSLLLITSQVKYAFLPMALATGLFFTVFLASRFRTGALHWRQTVTQWRAVVRTKLGVLAVLILALSGTFFVMRYGVNIAKYHSPVPPCNVVLSTERCMAYGPFGRDENLRRKQFNQWLDTGDRLYYPVKWYNKMVRETFFAVAPREAGYKSGNPLPVSYSVGYGLIITTTVVLLLRVVWLWRSSVYARLFIAMTGTYIAFLFAENLKAYLSTGAPVAIHGRYLLALLPFIGYLAYEAVRSFTWWKRWRVYGIGLWAIALLLLFYGGGIMPYVIRSQSSWYWPAAGGASDTVRSLFLPFIIR